MRWPKSLRTLEKRGKDMSCSEAATSEPFSPLLSKDRCISNTSILDGLFRARQEPKDTSACLQESSFACRCSSPGCDPLPRETSVDCHASEGTVLCPTEVLEAQGRPWWPPSRGQLPCVASPNTPTPHGPRAPSALPLRHKLRVGNGRHQARSSPLGPGTSAWGAPGRQGPCQEENQEPWLPNQPLSP